MSSPDASTPETSSRNSWSGDAPASRAPDRSGERASLPFGDEGPERAAIVRLTALGDVIHALPALTALRELWPRTRFDWIVEPAAATLLEGHPDLERVVVVPRKRWSRTMKHPLRYPKLAMEIGGVFREIRRGRYNLSIDFQGNLRSRVVAGAASLRRVGFHRGDLKEHRWLFPPRGPSRTVGRVHRIDRALDLVRWLGWTGTHRPPSRFPDLSAEHETLVAQYGRLDDLAILVPAVSAAGKLKQWPPARFVELAIELKRRGLRPLATPGPGEVELCQEIREASGGALEVPDGPVSLRDFVVLAREGHVTIGADTGPTHLAAASGGRVVGIYGPKDPNVYAPLSDRSRFVASRIPCSPCTLRKCSHAFCMESVPVRDVLAEIPPAT